MVAEESHGSLLTSLFNSAYKNYLLPLGSFQVLSSYNIESKYLSCGYFDTDQQSVSLMSKWKQSDSNMLQL